MTIIQKKRLTYCLEAISGWVLNPFQDVDIRGIAWDSRQVQPGDVFFALIGENSDGHRFAQSAVERGAAAVIGTQPGLQLDVPYVQIKGADRLAMAIFSSAFYDHPSQKLIVIGVTGTDGKTTTTNLIYHILRTAGIRAGMISTVNAVVGDEILDTGFHVTTPESPDVQRYLAQMVDAGLTHVVLEATSHGLAQERVAAVDFDLAVVTNITHEHLDFHLDYRGYLQAKGKLFEAISHIQPGIKGVEKLGVLNKDDQSYDDLQKITEAKQLSYSIDSQADLWADEITLGPAGVQFRVNGWNEPFQIQSNMVGFYNVANILAAIGATLVGLNIPISTIQQACSTVETIPGRMEAIDLGQDFLAIVDFAHTPNAIRQALIAARELTSGKIIAVFGSAGLRDVEKRKLMPETAAGLADEMILTAEDPRTESLDAILMDMAEGATRGGAVQGENFWLEPDRGNAIRRAVNRAERGDLVICLGKGHEQSMCFGTEEYLWDDRKALRAALSERLGIPGFEMPWLPTSDVI